MKKTNLILLVFCLIATFTVTVCAEVAVTTSNRVDITDEVWTKTVTDATSNIENWKFASVDYSWSEYTDYNTALSVEKSSKGVYSDITELSQNPRGRTGLYHESIQESTGGRVLQFIGDNYINFAVTFDIQAVNMWNAASTRKAYFDFGLIDNNLPVEDLQTGYEGKNYIRLGSSVDMQTLTIPSGIAGEEISPRAAVINTKTAEDYPNAKVVTQTDSITGAEYIESVTESGATTYWNQVINCKIVVDGKVMSIYMKFEDADEWKHINSYSVESLKDINKRFYIVCSGFQMLVSNFDIYAAKDPDVMVSEDNIGARKGSQILLNFTSDINETSVDTEHISLMTTNEEPSAIDITLSPSDSRFTYILTINEWLEYGEEYFLQFTDISNTLDRKMNKKIALQTKEFTTEMDFGDVSYSSGYANIPILANVEGDITTDIIVMVCDGVESLYCVKNLKYINSTVNTEDEISVEISVPTEIVSPFIKVMVVDNLSNIKMYANPAILNITQ